MDNQTLGLIQLLRAAITGVRETLPPDFDLEQTYFLAKRHEIAPVIYEGAIKCDIPRKLPVMEKLFKLYCAALLHNEKQMTEAQHIYDAFDAAGIDYMPLKGCNLKWMYPKPEIRLMGDADILIRVEQYDRIKLIMRKLGFTEQRESNHELVWHKETLHLELHKRLIPSCNRDYYRYFGDGWKLAKPSGKGCRHDMSDEDQMIYLLTHFAKHYRAGGIGIRHLLDLWVYRRAKPDLDESYIKTELKKLNLAEFYANILDTISAWFEGAEFSMKAEFISSFIIKSGVWGNHETHMISSVARNVNAAGSVASGQLRRVFGLLFPDYWVMRNRYPVLRSFPVLLPIFWPVRWCAGFLFRRKNIRNNLTVIASSDKIKTYQQALNYVGLSFDFWEKT